MSIWALYAQQGFIRDVDGRLYAGVFNFGLEELVAKSYASAVEALAVDSSNIYVGDSSEQKVLKLSKTTLGGTIASPAFGDSIYAMNQDTSFVYVGGRPGAGKLAKYKKSDLTLAASSPYVGNTIYDIAVDEEFIYVPDFQGKVVNKHRKDTLAVVAATPVLGANPYALDIDDGHVYIMAGDPVRVQKYDKSTLTLVDESAANIGTPSSIYCMTVDGDHLYVGGGPPYNMQKFRKSDLTLIAELPRTGASYLYAIKADGDKLYLGYSTSAEILTLDKATLERKGTTPFGGNVYVIVLDGNYVYVGGGSPGQAKRYAKTDLYKLLGYRRID